MTSPNTYTHGHHESVLRTHQWRTAENSAAYLLPQLDSGASLLDIGAGPGTITVDFAERVGHVTATEIGESELALSRRTAEDRGVTNLSFAVEDVHALSFADGNDDGYGDLPGVISRLGHLAGEPQAHARALVLFANV